MPRQTARPRRKSAKRPPVPQSLEIHDRIRLHMATTQRVLALIDRCTALRDAGKIEQARKLFRQVERLNERLLELEEIWPRLH